MVASNSRSVSRRSSLGGSPVETPIIGPHCMSDWLCICSRNLQTELQSQQQGAAQQFNSLGMFKQHKIRTNFAECSHQKCLSRQSIWGRKSSVGAAPAELQLVFTGRWQVQGGLPWQGGEVSIDLLCQPPLLCTAHTCTSIHFQSPIFTSNDESYPGSAEPLLGFAL